MYDNIVKLGSNRTVNILSLGLRLLAGESGGSDAAAEAQSGGSGVNTTVIIVAAAVVGVTVGTSRVRKMNFISFHLFVFTKTH